MSYEKPRIRLNDTLQSALAKMAGGNPGAITVMIGMIKLAPKIDPQGALGGLGAVMSLDTEGIYEERIWMLYKDVCGEDMVKTLACLRGSQLGFITNIQLNNAIDNPNGSFDVDDLLTKIKEGLKEFDVADSKEPNSPALKTE